MAIRGKTHHPTEDSDFDDEDGEGSTTEEYYSDDSEEDPTFDILEEARSSLSKLSIKKSKPRVSGKTVSDSKKELDFEEVEVPELDEADEKSFEKVEKIIQAGRFEKLKIDQCKVYLRKYRLRLTGTKCILIERIQEHLGIISGGGEEKYPVSSFVLNCKGDACTSDVVMFEQNVYEMYNIASRSASGPPCGTRIVAGRIVKESYGAAKQQHTFTIEVLWSKGMKPLPPLHPLLIKGRNLYRLKTMRQKWDDEEKRRKVLLEKHSRGSLARSNRETRIQEKEMRKLYTGKRETKKMRNTDEGQKKQTQSNPTKPSFPHEQFVQPQKQHSVESAVQGQFYQFQQQKTAAQPNTVHTGILKHNNVGLQSHHVGQSSSSNYPPRSPMRKDEPHHVQGIVHRQHPLANLNSPPRAHSPMQHFARNDHHSCVQPYRNENAPPPVSVRILDSQPRSPSWGGPKYSRPNHKQQICRFYLQGRCYYGDKCKYLHDKRKEHGWQSSDRHQQQYDQYKR